MSPNVTAPTLPPALAAAVASDCRPVRPLLSPHLRTLIAVGTAAAVGVVILTTFEIRSGVTPAFMAASVFVRFVLGSVLVAIALRDGVPAGAVPAGARTVAAAIAAAGLFFLPLLESAPSHAREAGDSLCYAVALVAAAPVGLALGLLLGRSYLMRPVSAMALAAFGAGYLADVFVRLICTSRNLEHAYRFHSGAVVTSVVIGCAIGVLLHRARAAAR